ncbi:peptide deformylase [Corynebacterium aquilae]|uniref:Peptide deformylase n=1 Tax=Corynebacterium aquilae DSM 44791 TaxID=1431546 RepID=A0A1L7CG69_9CORY|nr:peptide deformylase [Corynebacterium aquilae]APT84824.1 peptide deformylase [Corynebacterium aquilae DSM 44791]
MAVRPVRLFGDPVLKSEAEEITEFDDSLKQLVEDMLETMDVHGGVGLAANQIGLLKRIFVYDCSHETPGARGHVINPVWKPKGDDTVLKEEGCLSIPDIHADVERYAEVTVTGVDCEGNPVEFDAEGLLARCVQHETDHLDGVLFFKRLTPERRKAAMKEMRNTQWFIDGVESV